MRAPIFLALFMCSAAALADEWPYVKVTCDSAAQVLRVEENSADSSAELPVGKGIQALYDLTVLKTEDGPTGVQDYRVKKRDFRSSCNLRGAAYKVIVSPWKFSAKINGMCGGYSPSAQLSVLRNNQKLIDKLIFSGFCNPPESEFGITEVRLIAANSIAEFELIDQKGKYQKRISFTALPRLERTSLVRDAR